MFGENFIPMKNLFLLILTSLLMANAYAQQIPADPALLEQNKQIARDFYQDLWFTNNTGNYHKYVADTYVAHDIGDRKGVEEPAVEQKEIADFFWANGKMKCAFDYQVAEGDLVATRWTMDYQPETLLGRLLVSEQPLPIINVFRIKDGKIVELWNHRHDIDTRQTLKFTIQGLLIGLAIALIPTFWALRLKRRLKKYHQPTAG
jgi:predicted SnoaL-like aldol condensation-catalyzing enzyme